VHLAALDLHPQAIGTCFSRNGTHQYRHREGGIARPVNNVPACLGVIGPIGSEPCSQHHLIAQAPTNTLPHRI